VKNFKGRVFRNKPKIAEEIQAKLRSILRWGNQGHLAEDPGLGGPTRYYHLITNFVISKQECIKLSLLNCCLLFMVLHGYSFDSKSYF
jgi:hypothetical protein